MDSIYHRDSGSVIVVGVDSETAFERKRFCSENGEFHVSGRPDLSPKFMCKIK